MAFGVLSHTADTGIEATADSLADIIGELCAAMFGLIAPVEPSAARRWVGVNVVAQRIEGLVVDTLSELLYHAEVEVHLRGFPSIDERRRSRRECEGGRSLRRCC